MGVAMFLLWQLIGPALLAVSRTIVAGIWVAFFQECQQSSCGQGLLAMVAMMPVSYLTASTLSRFYKSVMALRDARVAKINEFLAAISLVKSNAWEEVFVSSIREQRKLELVSLLKYEPAPPIFHALVYPCCLSLRFIGAMEQSASVPPLEPLSMSL